jgi:hypothetical protein
LIWQWTYQAVAACSAATNCDARCGRFHPANSMTVHEVVGKSALGVLGEAGLRWG